MARRKKPETEVKPETEAKTTFKRFQNVSGGPLSIPGATLRDKEYSRAYTAEQIKAMSNNMKPYLDAKLLKVVNA